MTLPRTISGIAFPTQNWFLGPFRDGNGNHYVVVLDSADTSLVEVWKADNGDAVWAEQDGANRPDVANTVESMWAYQDGTRLKIITQDSGDDVDYHEFAMSDDGSADTWITADQSVATFTDTGSARACSIGVRSDGDKVGVFQGTRENVHGTLYSRVEYSVHEGTAWGDQAGNIDDGGEINYLGVNLVMGASDKAHILYHDITNHDVLHKSYSSGNSLSAAETVNDNAVRTENYPLRNAVFYDAAGTERITAAWVDAATPKIVGAEIDNDGVPGAEEAIADVASVLAMMAVDQSTDTAYCAYMDGASDVWLDENVNSGGWGTDTEILDLVTVTDFSTSIFDIDNGDTVLAYLYDDSGTIKYNEYVLVTGGDLTISVTDPIALSESVTRLMISYVSASSPVTISEAATVLLLHLVNVSDSVSLSETLTLQLLHFISVSESITLSEAITVLVPFLLIAVSDPVLLAETLMVMLDNFILASDAVALSEIVTMAFINLITVSDSIMISEVVTALLVHLVAVSDSISISEVITLLLISFVSVADSISLTEIVNVIADLDISVADAISISEIVNMLVLSFVSAIDGISISEVTAMLTISFISVSNSITLSESTVASLVHLLSVTSSVTIDSAVTARLIYLIQVADSITLTEAITFLVINFVSISESITVSEAVNVVIAIVGVLLVTVLDTISVSENVTSQLISFVNVLDNIGLSDSALSELNHLVVVSDNVAISESFNTMLQSFIHVTETITISELLSIIIVGLVTFRRATFKGMWKGMNRSMR